MFPPITVRDSARLEERNSMPLPAVNPPGFPSSLNAEVSDELGLLSVRNAMTIPAMNSPGFPSSLNAEVGDEFRILRAAASKAQDAAIRYETYTTSLLLVRNSVSQPNTVAPSYLRASDQPPLSTPSIGSVYSASPQERGEDHKVEDDYISISGGTKPCENPQPSDLRSGIILEGAEDRIRESDVNTFTSFPGAKSLSGRESLSTTVFDGRLKNNPTPASYATSTDPENATSHASSTSRGNTAVIVGEGDRLRKSRSESSSSTPRPRDHAGQRPHHIIPETVAEWINGGPKTASGRDGPAAAKLAQEPTEDKGTPKSPASRPKLSTALRATPGAHAKQRQLSYILPRPRLTQDAGKSTDQAEANFGFQNLAQSISGRHSIVPFTTANDLAFVQLFKDTVYPFIKASVERYRGRLSEDTLVSIGKVVSNQIVTPGFRDLVRDCSYELNDEQKDKVRTLIDSSFREKAVTEIAKISSSNRSNNPDQKAGEWASDNPEGRSKTEFSSQALTSHDSSASSLPVSTTGSNATNESLSGKNIEIAANNLSGTVADSSSFSGNTKLTLDSREASDAVLNEPSSSSSVSRKDRLLNAFQHTSFDGTEKSLEPDLSLLDTGKVHVEGLIDTSSLATGTEPAPPGHSSETKDKVEVEGQRNNEQVISDDNCKATKQETVLLEVTRKTQDKPNHLVDIRPDLNAGKDACRVRSNRDGDATPEPPIKEVSSSEEDGEQVLASWLGPKLTKHHVDRAENVPRGKVNSLKGPVKGSFTPRFSRKCAIICDSLASLFHDWARSVEAEERNRVVDSCPSDRSSDTEDLIMSLPEPEQRHLRKSTSSSSISSPPSETSDLESWRSFIPSAEPREDVGYPTDKQKGHSVRESAKEPSRRTKVGVRRQPESSQKRSSQRQQRPSQGGKKVAQHGKGPSQITVGAVQPVIVGGRLKNSDPDLTKSSAELALRQPWIRRPYNRRERGKVYRLERNNTIKHVDFSEEECEELLHAWLRHESRDELKPTSTSGPRAQVELQRCLQPLSRAQISAFIQYLCARPDNLLPGRSSRDIKAFLSDLIQDVATNQPQFVRVEQQVTDPCHRPLRSTASLLRHRELGLGSGRQFRNLKTELQLRTSENLQPWRSWKGASGDVVACAWAPCSNVYAIGAAAHANEEDLQYNRPRNLVLGDLVSNTIKELPDHRVARPKPETISSGPNSTQAVYDACDPMVYMTVSALRFSYDGARLYTGSHDKTVKIWDVTSRETACIQTLRHDDLVSDLDVSNFFRDVFATATKTIEDSIHIYFPESDDQSNPRLSCVRFGSSRAKERPHWKLYPECVRWGRTLNTSQLLLAGFQQWGTNNDARAREGEICLWNVHAGVNLKVTPGSQSIFTATWHPTLDLFATGGSPSRSHGLTHPHSTRSVIRTWDIRSLKRYAMEYECPAMDMQDVTFNPLYPNIVTAGCTDSATYVWDYRKPDDYLHRLQHGRPLSDWDHTRPQEEADPGIMMTVWGQEGTRLYTGSSDGIVKCWDVMRAPEDAHISDVGNIGAGVQSGAFSPDFSHLLVGDADGGVHLLSSAPVDRWADVADEGGTEPIKFIKARDATQTVTAEDDPGREGIRAAKELLESGRLTLHPHFGVGQGPNYRGPYATYARVEGGDPSHSQLLPEFEALQPISSRGHENLPVSRKLQSLLDERRQMIAETVAAARCRAGGDLGIIKDEKETEGHTPRPSRADKKRRLSDNDSTSAHSPKKAKWAIIDLCTPPPMDGEPGAGRSSVPPVEGTASSSFQVPTHLPSSSSAAPGPHPEGEAAEEIPESEMLEENHWWPRMDEEVFRAIRGPM